MKALLLCSYCGPDNKDGCTDENPCPDCLQMDNVVEIDEDAIKHNYGGLRYNNEVAHFKE
jgi:hypothetical protein